MCVHGVKKFFATVYVQVDCIIHYVVSWMLFHTDIDLFWICFSFSFPCVFVFALVSPPVLSLPCCTTVFTRTVLSHRFFFSFLNRLLVCQWWQKSSHCSFFFSMYASLHVVVFLFTWWRQQTVLTHKA